MKSSEQLVYTNQIIYLVYLSRFTHTHATLAHQIIGKS